MNTKVKEIIDALKKFSSFHYTINVLDKGILSIWFNDANVYFCDNKIIIEDEEGNFGGIPIYKNVDILEYLDENDMRKVFKFSFKDRMEDIIIDV